MTFIGELGFPAPLLKDASINESQARKLYLGIWYFFDNFKNMIVNL